MVSLYTGNRLDAFNSKAKEVIRHFRYHYGNSPALVLAQAAGVWIGLKVHFFSQSNTRCLGRGVISPLSRNSRGTVEAERFSSLADWLRLTGFILPAKLCK